MTDATVERHGVLIRLSYDGRPFAGFARQANARTVAGELYGALLAVDCRASEPRGASRTDAGVHARGQVVSFDACLDIPPRGWVHALNRELPEEIAVVSASRVNVGFDPRRHAVAKLYRYLVLESPVPDPLWRARAWRVPNRLNHELILSEARALVGRHDFRAFRTSRDQRPDTVRTIVRADIRRAQDDSRVWMVEIEGDRFLHRMIRIIAGTLVDVGRGRIAPGSVARALQTQPGEATGKRSALGVTAPPGGLYLERVDLDEAGRDNWPDHSS